MADQYFFNFTDPLKGTFLVNPFTTNGIVSPILNVLNTSAVSAASCLLFYGRGHPNYGERIEENILHLLEHFDGPTPPVRPIAGQLWSESIVNYHDSTAATGSGWYEWDGTTWDLIDGTGVIPTSQPAGPSAGDYYTSGSPASLFLRAVIESNSAWIQRRYTSRAGVPGAFQPERVLRYWNPDSATWELTSKIPTQQPTNPTQGRLWFDTTIPQLKVWTTAGWVSVAERYLLLAGGTMSGDINMNNDVGSPLTGSPLFTANTSGQNLIRGLADYEHTVSYRDVAVSKDYLDKFVSNFFVSLSGSPSLGVFVRLSGDTMNLNADITFNGGEVLGLPATPSVGSAATSRNYVQSTFVELAGDTMTGELAFSNIIGSPNIAIDVTGSRITGLPLFGDTAPDPTGAVSRDYVDNAGDGVVTSGTYSDPTPGTQVVTLNPEPVGSPIGSPNPFGSPIPASTPINEFTTTGLANDSTIYYTTITVDSISYVVTVVGQAAQTYSTLLSEINKDLSTAAATLGSNSIIISSFTAGPTSTVSITLPPGSPAGSTAGSPLELFSSLTLFNKFEEPVVGTESEIELTTSAPSTVTITSTHPHNTSELFYPNVVSTDILITTDQTSLTTVINEIVDNAASKTAKLSRVVESFGGSPTGSPLGGSPSLNPTTPQYTVGSNHLWVFVNGIKAVLGRDYSEDGFIAGTSSSITWIIPPNAGDTVEYIVI